MIATMALKFASRAALFRCSSVSSRCTAAVVASRATSHSFRYESRAFSSSEETPGIFDRMKGGLESRTKRQQQEKYAEQLQCMANADRWTLKLFLGQIEEAMPTGWRSKIPGTGNTKEAVAAKQTQDVIKGIIDEIGGDANVKDLDVLGRKEKLRISLKAGLSVEDINIMVKQFKSMEIMHKVLRTRKEEGKALPTDEDGMMALVQVR